MNIEQKPLTSLLIKPAGPDCNLSCGYCFYLPKSKLFPETSRHRMKERVLAETIRQALSQSGPNLSISWQGGEPTLMGLDFFKLAVKYEQTYGRGKMVSNAFQTNGMLLDRKWARFFKRYKFLVGISLDGPQHIHDHYRRNTKGRGSFARVHNSAKMLLAQEVAVNAMTCLTDYSIKHPKEIYDFHKQVGLIYMQFIPVVEPHTPGSREVAPFSVSAQKYGDFLCALFDLWEKDFVNGQPTTSVRLFESLFFHCLGEINPQCTFRAQCGDYLVVEHNGDVYPCDFFVDEQWKLGNVMNHRLIDLLNSEKQIRFRKQKLAVASACGQCDFREHCHGGCIKDRAFDSNRQNYFCEAYKRLFEHALPALERLARSTRL
jgi:uncharacterized protein